MRYIGGKSQLLGGIDAVVSENVPRGGGLFCDAFAGTGSVARHFKPRFQIVSNDVLHFSYVLQKATVEANAAPSFAGLRRAGIDDPAGWLERADVGLATGCPFFIAGNYSPAPEGGPGAAAGLACAGPGRAAAWPAPRPAPGGGRMYLTRPNAERVDFIRFTVEGWLAAGLLDEAEYYHLLARLIEGVPPVSNTAGTYGAYLKRWDRRALRPFALAPLEISDNGRDNRSFNTDANLLVRGIEGEVLYVDPPYTSRQYGSSYHLLETVSRYDSPAIHGVTGARDCQDARSAYCVRGEAEDAFEDLVAEARFRHLVVSYSDEGLVRIGRLEEVLRRHGTGACFRRYETPYRRYKSRTGDGADVHSEYVCY
ncbi:MAG: DNA adenine methylase, partial [Deltaproteobacteria bacterium]|nr:DNA adenine methylase [Deltaproteobacteria bacterium]